MTKHLFLASIVLLLALPAKPESLERFLVPIHLEVPVRGAYGSVWTSQLHILNTGSSDVWFEEIGPWCRFTCLATVLPANAQMLAPYVRGQFVNGIQGVVIRTPASRAEDLVFNLRVQDTSQLDKTSGTTIPVIRESAIKAGPVDLPAVPLRDPDRAMLRVYSLDPGSNKSVTVSVYATSDLTAPTDADLLITQVTLAMISGQSETQPASYAELVDLRSLPGVAAHDSIRVRVQPVGGFHVWAMVSITNNTTQQVTVIAPD